MTMIANLTGPALDWAVAKCMWPDAVGNTIPWHKDGSDYSPTTNWAHGGPIIEREGISINDTTMRGEGGNFEWCATRIEFPAVSEEYGPTPLIAAMRCYVASKLGDEIDVPDELVKE